MIKESFEFSCNSSDITVFKMSNSTFIQVQDRDGEIKVDLESLKSLASVLSFIIKGSE